MVIEKEYYDYAMRNDRRPNKTLEIMNLNTKSKEDFFPKEKRKEIPAEEIKLILDDIFSSDEFNDYLKNKKNKERIDGYKKDILRKMEEIEEGVEKSDYVAHAIEFLEERGDRPGKVLRILRKILGNIINKDSISQEKRLDKGENLPEVINILDKKNKNMFEYHPRNNKNLSDDPEAIGGFNSLQDDPIKKFDPTKDSTWTNKEKTKFDEEFERVGKEKKDGADKLKISEEENVQENEGSNKETAGLYNNEEDGIAKEKAKRSDLKKADGAVDNGAEKEFLGVHNDEDVDEAAELELADRIKQGSKEEGWDKKELSAEEIEESLKKNVDDARAKYASQDYLADKKKGMLKRILGLGADNIHSDTVADAYRKYQISLRELADHRTLKLRGAGLDAEGLHKQSQELLKYFDTDEKLNLYESRTNARTEAWKDKFGGKVMEKAGNFVNWYRKQKWWAKTGIGIALTMGGFGAAAMGMRVVGGAAAGVGTTAWLEGRHRRKESQQTESRRNESMKQLEGAEMEQKLNQLTLMLDAEMDTYHKSLQNEKSKAKNRKLIGASLGVFIGSGGMSEMFQKIGDVPFVKVATEYWGGKLHGISSMIAGINNPNISNETMSAHGTNVPDEMMSSHGGPKIPDEMMSSHDPNTGMSPVTGELDYIDEKIGYQGGKSVWSEAEKQLSARMKDSFDSLGGGDAKMAEALKTINIDRLKDVIVGDPEKYGLPKGIDFNRMSAEQIGSVAWGSAINDSIGDVSGLTESVSPEDAQSILNNNEALQSNVEAPGVEKVVETAAASAPENATEVINGVESVADSADYESFLEESKVSISDISKVDNIYDQYPELRNMNMSDLNRELGYINEIEDLDKYKSIEELKKIYAMSYINSYNSLFGLGTEEVKLFEKLPAEKYISENSQSKAVKVFESLKKGFSPEEAKYFDPRPDEPVKKWAMRIVDYAKYINKK